MFEPDAKRTDWILIRVSERINSSSAVNDSSGFVVLTWFLISADCLGNQFTISRKFNNNSSRITYIYAEELLAQCHHGYTGRPREPDVHLSIEEFFVAIEEGIVESDADFISV